MKMETKISGSSNSIHDDRGIFWSDYK